MTSVLYHPNSLNNIQFNITDADIKFMLEPNEIMKEISLDANKNEPTNVTRKKYGIDIKNNGTEDDNEEEEHEHEETAADEEQQKEKKPPKKIKIPNTLIIFVKTLGTII